MPTTAPPASAVLGFVAAERLAAFDRIAQDAVHAPSLELREVLSRLAADQLAGYEGLLAAADRSALVTSHLDLLTGSDARTVPADWWERAMRAVVLGGMVRDLAGVLADWLAAERQLSVAPVPDPVQPVLALLAPAVADDEPLRARLALWGRRLAGEALGLVQPTVSRLELPELAPVAMGAMSSGHARRMDRLGLTA